MWWLGAVAWAVTLEVPPWAVPPMPVPIGVHGLAPGEPVVLAVGASWGTGWCPAWAFSVCLDLDAPVQGGPAGLADADGSWSASLTPNLSPGGWWAQAAGAWSGAGAAVAFEVLAPDADEDGDGLDATREAVLGTSPFLPDSDGDGWTDRADLWPIDRQILVSVVPDDRVVSLPGRSLPDPEFDPVHGLVGWQDADGHEVWIAGVDPTTGTLVPKDGRGRRVDTDVLPIEVVKNGPEWGRTPGGPVLLYGKNVGGVDQVMAAGPATGWVPAPVTAGRAPFATRGDTAPWLYHFRTVGGVARSWVRLLDAPSTARLIPGPLVFGRWDDDRGVLLGLVPVGARLDVGEVDPATGASAIRVDLPVHKRSVFGWVAPELGVPVLLVTVGTPDATEPLALLIYRQAASGWVRHATIRAPAAFPYVVSPHPFVVGGRSYVVYRASTTPFNEDDGASHIWVTTVDPGDARSWRVSGPGEAVRKDPEPYVVGDEAWIYYSELVAGVGSVLHRCRALP